jgi:hypothetical protein
MKDVPTQVIASLIVGLLLPMPLDLSLKCRIIIVAVCIVITIIYNKLKPYCCYDDEKRKEDKKRFNKITRELNGHIYFLKGHDFRNAFDVYILRELYEFACHPKQDHNYKFLNSKIKKLKKELIQHIIVFKDIVSENTIKVDIEMLYVPIEKYIKPELYNDAIQSIRTAANKICESYDKFVDKGRKLLKV